MELLWTDHAISRPVYQGCGWEYNVPSIQMEINESHFHMQSEMFIFQ